MMDQPVDYNTTIEDQDTGVKHEVEVYNPQFGAEDVKITFGKSFSLQMTWPEAMELASALHRAGEFGVEMQKMLEDMKK